jgi:hypothetical protein
MARSRRSKGASIWPKTSCTLKGPGLLHVKALVSASINLSSLHEYEVVLIRAPNKATGHNNREACARIHE